MVGAAQNRLQAAGGTGNQHRHSGTAAAAAVASRCCCRLTQAGVAVAAAVEDIRVLVLARSLRQHQCLVIVCQGCHPVSQALVSQAPACTYRGRG